MSKLITGIFGALALSLSFGAAQFALGRDLPETAPAPAGGINRAAKADRIAGAAASAAQTRTIALRLDAFSDTSFLVRVPLAKAPESPSVPPKAKPAGLRPMLPANRSSAC